MALPFMTVSNQSGKKKRNTEQTALTLLAAIDPAFRLPFHVPEQKRNSLSDDRNWETLPQPCIKIRIAGEIRPTPSPAIKCL